MGIYLSTPCSDVECEEGEGNGVKYAVAEMQGWRKNMEDAHITIPDLKSFTNSDNVHEAISVFGVFDGHGGKEVAKFTKLKYADTLVALDSFKNGQIELALRESFHKIDELLEDGEYDGLLKELRALPNPSDNPKESKSGPSEDAFLKNVRGELDFDEDDGDIEEGGDSKTSKKGKGALAGLSTTQAVDLIRSILHNASKKPEARAAAALLEDFDDDDDDEEEEGDEEASAKAESKFNDELVSTKSPSVGAASKANPDDSADEKSSSSSTGIKRDSSKKEFDSNEQEGRSGSSDEKGSRDTSDVTNSPKRRNPNLSLTIDDNDAEGTAMDVVESEGSSSGNGSNSSNSSGAKAVDDSIINYGGASTALVAVPSAPTSYSDRIAVHPGSLNKSRYENPNAVYGPPAVLSGSTMTCKLKDHRIPAGCTAIVAFKIGNQLYVANAGDSRGVLCRAGNVAYALSEDHKPQQKTEMDRIQNAGGFVNVVGRINGNLNLSRSLGDMKYKQLLKLSRAEQIITADPDISVTTIEESDRFFILACDGIWDCLTNQQAVDFVSERLDLGMSVTDIVHDMCKKCLADDPRAATGIGSDNMTCMVVLLNQ